MTKTILKYLSLALVATTTILAIITLVNYYNYANVLSELQTGELNLLTRFELQENKDLYLYRTLRLIPWTCYMAIITALTSVVTLFLNMKQKHTNNYKKIR